MLIFTINRDNDMKWPSKFQTIFLYTNVRIYYIFLKSLFKFFHLLCLHTLYTMSVYLYIYIHITAFEIRSIKVNVFSASSPQAVAIFSLSNRTAWMLGDLNINTLLYQKGNL